MKGVCLNYNKEILKSNWRSNKVLALLEQNQVYYYKESIKTTASTGKL